MWRQERSEKIYARGEGARGLNNVFAVGCEDAATANDVGGTTPTGAATDSVVLVAKETVNPGLVHLEGSGGDHRFSAAPLDGVASLRAGNREPNAGRR